MPSRREVLRNIGIGAAGCAVVSAGTSVAKATRRATLQALATGGNADTAPWWLIAPLGPGKHVGKGWRIEDLSKVESGAAVLTLRHNDGAVARTHICSRGSRGLGVAQTALFDLVLMDGGDGTKPTDENIARVLQGIRRRIAKNELKDIDSAELRRLARMMTHAERVDTFGPESLV